MASSLEDHEAICAERYAGIEQRLTRVEEAIIAIGDKIDSNFKTLIMITLGSIGTIGTLVGIMVALVGLN